MISRSSLTRSTEVLSLVARVVMLISRETLPVVEFFTTRERKETGILSNVAMSLLMAFMKSASVSDEVSAYCTRYGVLRMTPSSVDLDESDSSFSISIDQVTGRNKGFPTRSSTPLTVSVTLLPDNSENYTKSCTHMIQALNK